MKEIIYTSDAPAPIGPYSQAVKVGNTLYVSGQIAIDPESGELKISSIKEETEQVMANMQAILAAANITFSQVVKCGIFLKRMSDFNEVNEIYATYFPSQAPARETVEVSQLPKNVNVEISCIAVLDS